MIKREGREFDSLDKTLLMVTGVLLVALIVWSSFHDTEEKIKYDSCTMNGAITSTCTVRNLGFSFCVASDVKNPSTLYAVRVENNVVVVTSAKSMDTAQVYVRCFR